MTRNGGAEMPITRPTDPSYSPTNEGVAAHRCAELIIALAAGAILSQGCAMFGPPVIPATTREQQLNRSLYASGPTFDESRLQAILEEEPDNVAALLQLADRYRKSGDLDSAGDLVNRAKKIAPESSLVRVRHAELLADRGSTLAARWEVERILQREKFGEAYALKGKLLWERGKRPEALDAWEKGWKAPTPSVDAGVALARWDMQQQDWEGAAAKLRIAAAMKPEDAEIRRSLAKALAGGGDAGAAAEQLERAVALGDKRQERYFHLAALHQRSGDRKAAEDYFQRGREIAPDHPLREDVADLLDAAPERPSPRSIYRPLSADPPSS
jgi:tetratricopeptide (TPR) repeat protein